MPYISVVVPTTRVGGLDITFSSLELQTFKDFELIIVDGVYERRRDLITEQSKKYSFTVKHVPQPSTATTFSRALNNGAANAEGHVMYIFPDYTWLKSDCLQIHANFHKNNEKFAVIGRFDDHSLPILHKDFYRTYASNAPWYRENTPEAEKSRKYFIEQEIKYYNEYISDISSGRLNELMWSIFETPFTTKTNPKTFQISIKKDPVPEGIVDSRKCICKNESYKIETILEINGWNEALDGSHGWADFEFADRLTTLTDTKLYHKPDAIAYTVNPRTIMYARSRDVGRDVFSNEAIWEQGVKTKFKDRVNNYSLKGERNKNIKLQETPKIIHSTKKPYITVICPTMRIGGLDTVFNSLETQIFKEFELIVSDSLYNYRKDIVKEKAKEYTFKYKHISPIADKFPVFSQAHGTNSAIVQAEGDIILFVTDYRYFMPETLKMHAEFHKAHADNVGYAPGSKFLLPAPIKDEIPTYGRNANYKQYVEDLKSGRLNDYMWSIFKDDDPEQRLRREDDERHGRYPADLGAQQVEVLGRRSSGTATRMLSPAHERQEPLDPGRGVLGALALVAVGQEQHQAGMLAPLVLGGDEEVVDDDLGAVDEVAELGLPGHQARPGASTE